MSAPTASVSGFADNGGNIEGRLLRLRDSQPGSLDEYMKAFLNRAAAGWAAVILERRGFWSSTVHE